MSTEQPEGAVPVTTEEVVKSDVAVSPPEPVKPTPEEVEAARKKAQEIFDYYDADKSGFIDATDVENVIRKWIANGTCRSLTDDEIKELSAEYVKQQDENADAKVSFDEIYNAVNRGDEITVPIKLTPEIEAELKKEVQEILDYYDLDKNGYIDATDIENVFRKYNDAENNIITFTEEDLKLMSAEFMKEGDTDADAKITFDEIYKAMLKYGGYEV
jgi:Ca2+-binding EF-hand superfamily protein